MESGLALGLDPSVGDGEGEEDFPSLFEKEEEYRELTDEG